MDFQKLLTAYIVEKQNELNGREVVVLTMFASWLNENAVQQSGQRILLTRCPKCNAVTGWHHPLCEDYSPESQSG